MIILICGNQFPQVYDANNEALFARLEVSPRQGKPRQCQTKPKFTTLANFLLLCLKLRAVVRKMSYTITPLLSITEIDYKIIQLKTKPLAISKVRGKYESLEMGEKSSEFV